MSTGSEIIRTVLMQLNGRNQIYEKQKANRRLKQLLYIIPSEKGLTFDSLVSLNFDIIHFFNKYLLSDTQDRQGAYIPMGKVIQQAKKKNSMYKIISNSDKCYERARGMRGGGGIGSSLDQRSPL